MAFTRARHLVALSTLALVAGAIAPADAARVRRSTAAAGRSGGHGLPAFEEQQRYRAELGLAAGIETVKDLNAQWARGALPGAVAEGAVFTAAEEQELHEREAAGREIAVAARAYFTGSRRDAFGGVYIDHGTGQTVVLVTGDAARYASALRGRVSRPERMRLSIVRFSLADLDRVTAELTAQLPTLRSVGADISAVGPHEQDNVVDVNLVRDSPAARAAVISAVAAVDRPMLRFWASGPMELDGVDALNAPPLKGGQRITQPSSTPGYINNCTSAFVAYERVRTDALIYVTNYHLVTAGHCDENGNPWSQYQAYPIGVMDRTAYVNNGADAMRIPINAADRSQRVAITATNDRFMYYRQASSADVVNERVCVSGATTGGEPCGVLVHRGITVTNGGRSLPYTRIASYSSQGGDSGGSVLNNSEGKGIHSGRVVYNGVNRAAYSHISIALSKLGLTDISGVGGF